VGANRKALQAITSSETKVRQNMSEEEEQRLLAVAFTHPRRRVVGHCLVIMANTSMGFGELRHLRRQDVFLLDDPPFVEVNAGKNDYRLRSIPLNFLALRSMRWLVNRWEQLGGTQPDQYILPHHGRRTEQEKSRRTKRSAPVFSEPMGHIYRAARGILKDAGLSHLDPYDMRSHAITKLLSNPAVSDQMYTEIVGHVGQAMKRRYSKQRMENKRGAMDAMCKGQVDLCERQADSEVKARNQGLESEVRSSLGLPAKLAQSPLPPVSSVGPSNSRGRRRTMRRRLAANRPMRATRPPSTNFDDPALKEEIDRRVTAAVRAALQREREQHPVQVTQAPPANSARLIRFPGAG
jgi:hypothetical protein